MVKAVLLITWILFMLISQSCARASGDAKVLWQELPPLPVAMSGQLTIDTPEGPLVAGGSTWKDGQKHWLDDAWRFSSSSNAWEHIGRLSQRTGFAAALVQDQTLFAIGGTNETGATASVAILSLGSPPKGQAVPSLQLPRALLGYGQTPTWLVLVGGMTDPNLLTSASDTVVRLNIEDKQAIWRPAKPYPGGPIVIPAVAAVGQSIFVFGGMRGATKNTPAGDSDFAAQYMPETDVWVEISRLPSPRRGAAAIAINKHQILIIGGCTTKQEKSVMLDDVLMYDVGSDRYSSVASLPYAAACIGVVMHEQHLYVFGGEDKMRSRSAQCFRCEVKQVTALR